MLKILGEHCNICKRDGITLHIHHMYYNPDDVIYDNYSNPMEYYVNLYNLVKK